MSKSLFDTICEENIFSSLFSKYSKSLHDFLYYKYGSHIHPEDKVQEAFIKLWDNCSKVSAEKAKSFLFTVANNTVLNDLKHQKVVLNYQKKKTKHHTNETPEFLLEEAEYMKKYQNALSKLTEGQREAFLLNRIEGKRHKEIAALLNISVKGVEKRLYGALKSLRKEIEGI
jgi:RNA polymerase sigma-70 factor (family 1)